jgi:hypothetical protein
MRTIDLGVTITDAVVDDQRTMIFCVPVARDPRCPDCGRDGRYRDTVMRPLTDLPVAGYLLILRIGVPRYRCVTVDCGGQCSIRIWVSWPPQEPQRQVGARGMRCGG